MPLPVQDRLLILVAAAFTMNVPLGYLRQGTRKFSFKWFAYIHLSIPFIILLRMSMDVSAWYIPLSFASAVAGQIAGGRMKKPGNGE